MRSVASLDRPIPENTLDFYVGESVLKKYELAAQEKCIAHTKHQVKRLIDQYPDLQLSIVLKLKWGDPRAAILAVADEVQPDMVVVGSHGRGNLKSIFLGSVSNHIVNHSKYPVIVYRKPHEEHHKQHFWSKKAVADGNTADATAETQPRMNLENVA